MCASSEALVAEAIDIPFVAQAEATTPGRARAGASGEAHVALPLWRGLRGLSEAPRHRRRSAEALREPSRIRIRAVEAFREPHATVRGLPRPHGRPLASHLRPTETSRKPSRIRLRSVETFREPHAVFGPSRPHGSPHFPFLVREALREPMPPAAVHRDPHESPFLRLRSTRPLRERVQSAAASQSSPSG